MTKWNMIIDVARCMNCHNCTLASKDEHVGNSFPGYAAPQPRHGHEWIKIERYVRGEGAMVDVTYRPAMCNHCDNAPCIKAAGEGVIHKRADGIVLIDPEKARGRRDLVDACPYGAIWWNEEENVPQHWFFDAHLLDQGWSEPRCAQVCPTRAFEAVRLDDEAMRARAAKEGLHRPNEEWGTHPRVYYKNLHRATTCFIGGTVTAQVEGRVECIADAQVVLRQGGNTRAALRTDLFGDFKFDSLAPGSGPYQIEASHPAFGTAQIVMPLQDRSRYVEDLRLSL